MNIDPSNPVIVQGDGKILLETHHPKYEETREFLSTFAELESSPDQLHTYHITPVSLWNAASSGAEASEIIENLRGYSKFDVPDEVKNQIGETISRYGLVQIIPHPYDPYNKFRLRFENAYINRIFEKNHRLREFMVEDEKKNWAILGGHRGVFKQRALNEGWPIEDIGGFFDGDSLEISLRDQMKKNGGTFAPRHYQWAAVNAWHQEGHPSGGYGVVVLACGAGKTIVGLTAMSMVKRKTLILATNQASVNQWISEILDKTTISPDDIGAYTGESKEIRPVTVATYQIITYRRSKESEFEHLHLFDDEDWGLVIYDEVHLLPAPVFGVTASLQGRRRLGLTATLIREDGREGDVFSLVGPKRYDLPWQQLESEGHIATISCHELRVPMNKEVAKQYHSASNKDKFYISSTNPGKIPVIKHLIRTHPSDNILIIGTYVDQLNKISQSIRAPIITGKTPNKKREVLFEKFRSGRLKVLVVSKVANFSIDLPDANIGIQVSGSFGSRQEEAQRLGRILRPKEKAARFYTLVTEGTKEQDFAMKRQLFLTEQGYRYSIEDAVVST
jgi:DNA excision repair protein ERCC-3